MLSFFARTSILLTVQNAQIALAGSWGTVLCRERCRTEVVSSFQKFCLELLLIYRRRERTPIPPSVSHKQIRKFSTTCLSPSARSLSIKELGQKTILAPGKCISKIFTAITVFYGSYIRVWKCPKAHRIEGWYLRVFKAFSKKFCKSLLRYLALLALSDGDSTLVLKGALDITYNAIEVWQIQPASNTSAIRRGLKNRTKSVGVFLKNHQPWKMPVKPVCF